MDDDKGPLKRIEGAMESALFASRWLLAPFYLGLALSLVVLLIKFLAELAHIATHAFSATESEVILGVLALVDLSLTGSLIVIVIFSGYENFVSRIDHGNHRDWPEWMGKIDFSALKLKLLSSIVAISAIQLLKQFMAIKTVSDRDIMWLVIVHVVFVVSSVLLALSDRIAVHSDHGHGKNGGGDGGSHAKPTASDDTGHAEPASQATQSAPLAGTRTAGIAPQGKAAPATAIKVTRVKIQRTGNHIEAGREHSDFDGACAADYDLLQETHRSATIKRRLH